MDQIKKKYKKVMKKKIIEERRGKKKRFEGVKRERERTASNVTLPPLSTSAIILSSSSFVGPRPSKLNKYNDI